MFRLSFTHHPKSNVSPYMETNKAIQQCAEWVYLSFYRLIAAGCVSPLPSSHTRTDSRQPFHLSSASRLLLTPLQRLQTQTAYFSFSDCAADQHRCAAHTDLAMCEWPQKSIFITQLPIYKSAFRDWSDMNCFVVEAACSGKRYHKGYDERL